MDKKTHSNTHLLSGPRGHRILAYSSTDLAAMAFLHWQYATATTIIIHCSEMSSPNNIFAFCALGSFNAFILAKKEHELLFILNSLVW